MGPKIDVRSTDEIIPEVTVKDDSDPSPTIKVIVWNEPHDPDRRFRYDQIVGHAFIGVDDLYAVATNRQGGEGKSNKIKVDITEHPKRSVSTAIEDYKVHRSPNGEASKIDLTILFGSSEFDVRDTYLSTTWLHLRYPKDVKVSDKHYKAIYIAGAYPEGGSRYDHTTVEARYSRQGYWRVHFHADYTGLGVTHEPERFELRGDVYNKECEVVAFFQSEWLPLMVDPDPVETLREKGALKETPSDSPSEDEATESPKDETKP